MPIQPEWWSCKRNGAFDILPPGIWSKGSAGLNSELRPIAENSNGKIVIRNDYLIYHGKRLVDGSFSHIGNTRLGDKLLYLWENGHGGRVPSFVLMSLSGLFGVNLVKRR